MIFLFILFIAWIVFALIKFSNSFSLPFRIWIFFLFPHILLGLSLMVSSLPFSIMSQYANIDSEAATTVIAIQHMVITLVFFTPLYLYLINRYHGCTITLKKFLLSISITTILFILFNLF